MWARLQGAAARACARSFSTKGGSHARLVRAGGGGGGGEGLAEPSHHNNHLPDAQRGGGLSPLDRLPPVTHVLGHSLQYCIQLYSPARCTQVELSDVTSRYRKPAGVAFGTSPRFKMNYSTF
jgi:hypothetical protein